MRFTYIDELKTVLTNELKESNLNKKALDEMWKVVNSLANKGYEVTKEHLVNYYLTCVRFEQLKDNI
jgi:hypothetical protein